MSDNKKVTLKDIANKTGYSLISVHRAVQGKEGISEKARVIILKAVEEMGYEVNYVASALKRKSLNFAFISAKSINEGDYYNQIIQGCKKCISEFTNLNFKVSYFFYDIASDAEKNELSILDEILKSEILYAGIVILPITTSFKMENAIEKLIIRGSQVVFLDNDFPLMHKIGCIAPQGFPTGKLAAELLGLMNLPYGKIIIAAGSINSRVHKENLKGFESYLLENNFPFDFIEIYDDNNDDIIEMIKRQLIENESVIAMYSIRERTTIKVCKAAIDLKLSDNLIIIGSDMIPINQEMLEKDVLKAIIDKNPKLRGYLAIKTLLEKVLKNKSPDKKIINIQSQIILKNNLPYFE